MLSVLIPTDELWQEFILLLDWNLNYDLIISHYGKFITLSTNLSTITVYFSSDVSFPSVLSDLFAKLFLMSCHDID